MKTKTQPGSQQGVSESQKIPENLYQKGEALLFCDNFQVIAWRKGDGKVEIYKRSARLGLDGWTKWKKVKEITEEKLEEIEKMSWGKKRYKLGV